MKVIEERIEACCDKQVAEVLKELLCEELEKTENDNQTVEAIKKKIDYLIETKFSSVCKDD